MFGVYGESSSSERASSSLWGTSLHSKSSRFGLYQRIRFCSATDPPSVPLDSADSNMNHRSCKAPPRVPEGQARRPYAGVLQSLCGLRSSSWLERERARHRSEGERERDDVKASRSERRAGPL